LVIGFGGAIISLLISKPMAKWTTGVRIISQPQNVDEAWIVEAVRKLADTAGIGMPEVGIFDGAPNAFATGAFKNSALVVEALRRYRPTRRTYVLCFESSETAGGLAGDYEVLDPGWVPSAEEAATAYSAADLFLMPSRAEAFGLMAVEAMACGVPVIVADGTSLPGVVKAPDVGISVPQGDAEALASAIGSLLADPVARRRRGHAGRELVEREYSFERYIETHLRLYEEVAGR